MSEQSSAEQLPIKSITYNHGVKRVVIDFFADQFVVNCPVELSIGEKQLRTKSWKITPEGKPERIVAVFDDVTFLNIDVNCILRARVKDSQISYKYKPSAHIVVDWRPAPDLLEDLTTLVAFPRSGSQFVQNVIKKNTSGIVCASMYSNEPLMRKRLNLRSHALNMGDMRSELRTIWDTEVAKFKPIVLVRDPRDIFLSIYDFVWKTRKVKIEPKDFLDADYYWYFFEPEKIAVVRGRQTRALSMVEAYKTWYRNWVAPIAPPPGSLQVKYEDLIGDPFTAFGTIFKHIGQAMPEEIKALDKIVAKGGGTRRARAEPQGWRTAPAMYQPIIQAVSNILAEELRDMGYKN